MLCSIFSCRFTQLVGLLRQRAHASEPLPAEHTEFCSTTPSGLAMKHVLLGRISAPATFRGTIYVGLFPSPIPQGRPVRCTTLSSPGWYRLQDVADGVYHLRAAAFPVTADPHSALLPGEKLLLGNNARALVIRHGQVFGDPDLVLHPPRLTDPPLVMGLPLPSFKKSKLEEENMLPVRYTRFYGNSQYIHQEGWECVNVQRYKSIFWFFGR